MGTPNEGINGTLGTGLLGHWSSKDKWNKRRNSHHELRSRNRRLQRFDNWSLLLLSK